jgi:hypothetical protein
MVRGSCLCGDVVWEAAGDLEWMSHCHCSMCRKAHGSAFATFVAAPADGFRLVRGRDRVARYESSPGFLRPFCSRCGSVVVAAEPAGQRVFMPAGCLDDDPDVRPAAHIFVASRAVWHEIADDLPRFDPYPPGVGAAEVTREPRPVARAGAVGGSCLCGGVAYEVEGGLEAIYNCHCSRCRKARSAAHACNAFAEASRFCWVRGEELLESFKVPEAKRFASCFCRVCGSSLPRVYATRGRAVIPAGTLDGDPGARERFHIFCGSKAPWYEISDGLPQFEEYEPGRS